MIGLLLLLLPILHTSGPACLPIDGDRIVMRDLAKADTRFDSVDAEMQVGFAPQPGTKRVFWPLELSQLAKRSGITSSEPFAKTCFEQRTQIVSADDIIAAVRAWAPAEAKILLLDRSRFPAPIGELVLPRPDVSRAANDGSVLLHGFIRFGASHKFPVWARIRLTIDQTVAVALEQIPMGSEVRTDQVKMEERASGIEATRFASDLDRVVGRTVRKRITAGDAIDLSFLEEPNQVRRGSIVSVQVKDGATLLSLDARAETDGRIGQNITVRNPSSGRSFQAKVTGENAAVVFPRGMHLDRRSQN